MVQLIISTVGNLVSACIWKYVFARLEIFDVDEALSLKEAGRKTCEPRKLLIALHKIQLIYYAVLQSSSFLLVGDRV